MLIGVINNGLNILNMSSLYTPLVKGLVILFAVGMDSYYRAVPGSMDGGTAS